MSQLLNAFKRAFYRYRYRIQQPAESLARFESDTVESLIRTGSAEIFQNLCNQKEPDTCRAIFTPS